MKPSKVTVLVVSAIVLSTFAEFAFAAKETYARAVVESCSGCRLNRLSDVKAFVFEDVPLYENVEFKHIQGAPPELVFYNDTEEEIERIQLEPLSREECKKLLHDRGFKKSNTIKDEI